MKIYKVYYSYDIELADNSEDYPIIKWGRDTFEMEFENGFDSVVAKAKINAIAQSACGDGEKVKYANYYKIEEL